MENSLGIVEWVVVVDVDLVLRSVLSLDDDGVWFHLHHVTINRRAVRSLTAHQSLERLSSFHIRSSTDLYQWSFTVNQRDGLLHLTTGHRSPVPTRIRQEGDE